MSDINDRDRKFAGAMLKSKMEFPSADLESIVMSRIQIEKSARTVLKNKRLSFLFLVIEIVLGLVIDFTLARFPVFLPGIPHLTLLNVFQAGFVVILLVQLELFLSTTPRGLSGSERGGPGCSGMSGSMSGRI